MNGAAAFGNIAWRNDVWQVLFCKLCKDQRDLYRAYLNSQEVDAIFAGNRQALAGIDILRKICNHPDLLERTKWEGSEEYGRPEKSGKLTVLMKVCCVCSWFKRHPLLSVVCSTRATWCTLSHASWLSSLCTSAMSYSRDFMLLWPTIHLSQATLFCHFDDHHAFQGSHH